MRDRRYARLGPMLCMVIAGAAMAPAAMAQGLVYPAPPATGTGADTSSLQVRLEPWDLTVTPVVDSASRRVVALDVTLPAGAPRRIDIDAADCDAGSLKIEERNGEAWVTMNGWRTGPDGRELVRCLWRIDIRTWGITERPALRLLHTGAREGE